jgi:spore maturation protein CgeB
MNILVVGRKYTESFAMHIAETFEAMGHTVMVFEPGIKTQQAANPLHHRYIQVKTQLHHLYKQSSWGRQQEEARLKNFLKEFKPELVLSCHDFLTPAQLQWLKNTFACKTALWFPDAISNFGKAMFLDAAYDALFFKEPFVVDVLKRELQKNVFYLPECCNPVYHNKVSIEPTDIEKYGCDITTAGNMHTARAAFFKLLEGYNIKIWGNPAPAWMDTKGIQPMIQNHFVSNQEKSKAFACSKVVINTMHPTEIEAVNVRLFEIAATGSFQICNYRKSLELLYTPEEEIVFFNTIEELHRLLKKYLNDPDARTAIAEKAYRRTMAEHTYEKRLQQLLNTVQV